MRSTLSLLFAMIVLAGCGVPVERTATPIEPEAIPAELRSPAGPRAVPTTAAPGKPGVEVHFVRKDRLIGLTRESPTTASADRLNTVVQALLTGPSKGEQANGISSALPAGLRLSVIDVQGERVILELTGETDGRSATENILAVGQIVLSFTAVPSIDEVSFQHDGAPVEALLADGALTTKPLTAADYASLRLR